MSENHEENVMEMGHFSLFHVYVTNVAVISLLDTDLMLSSATIFHLVSGAEDFMKFHCFFLISAIST